MFQTILITQKVICISTEINYILLCDISNNIDDTDEVICTNTDVICILLCDVSNKIDNTEDVICTNTDKMFIIYPKCLKINKNLLMFQTKLITQKKLHAHIQK